MIVFVWVLMKHIPCVLSVPQDRHVMFRYVKHLRYILLLIVKQHTLCVNKHFAAPCPSHSVTIPILQITWGYNLHMLMICSGAT